MVKQVELQLETHMVFDGDQVGLRNLEGLLRDISQVGKSRLDSLDALFLRVLLNFGEGCRSVQDSQRLEPLLQDLPVVGRETEWIAHEIQHLDVFKRFKLRASLSEIA